jgi:hypothetical protein
VSGDPLEGDGLRAALLNATVRPNLNLECGSPPESARIVNRVGSRWISRGCARRTHFDRLAWCGFL